MRQRQKSQLAFQFLCLYLTLRGICGENVEVLGPDGLLTMKWKVDKTNDTITFELIARTTGYVGIGISPSGSMKGADLFVGGVDKDGKQYSQDMHSKEKNIPLNDTKSDWNLLSASEENGTTSLKVSRKLDTGDDQDYPIGDYTTRLIWSLGESDEIKYHGKTLRGSKSLNLLSTSNDEELFNKMKGNLTHQTIRTNVTMMPQWKFPYHCSFHKFEFDEARHIVAFEAHLPDKNSLRHTHHFILYNCHTHGDSKLEKTLESSINRPGHECYGTPVDPVDPVEKQLQQSASACTEYLFVWAIGGKTFILPKEVGYRIGDRKNQYFMLEVHYDNPNVWTFGIQTSMVTFETGVKFYYTDKMRKFDAGILTVGHEVTNSLIVPPNVSNFTVVGHCSPQCTNSDMFPKTGIQVFANLLHSHLAGRQLKLRHFRGHSELPNIDYEKNYDFDFQQNKILPKPVKILPGDQLTYECTYDSTNRSGELIEGGLMTTQEMCTAFLWHYPKSSLDLCESSIPLDVQKKELQKLKYNGTLDINLNLPLATLHWTDEIKAEMQETRRFGKHNAFCHNRLFFQPNMTSTRKPNGTISYPSSLETSSGHLLIIIILLVVVFLVVLAAVAVFYLRQKFPLF